MSKPKKIQYKRILLKLSGEAFQGSDGFGIDPEACKDIAIKVDQVRKKDVEVAIVLGG